MVERGGRVLMLERLGPHLVWGRRGDCRSERRWYVFRAFLVAFELSDDKSGQARQDKTRRVTASHDDPGRAGTRHDKAEQAETRHDESRRVTTSQDVPGRHGELDKPRQDTMSHGEP